MNYRIYDRDGELVKTIAVNAPELVALNTPEGGRADPEAEPEGTEQ